MLSITNLQISVVGVGTGARAREINARSNSLRDKSVCHSWETITPEYKFNVAFL